MGFDSILIFLCQIQGCQVGFFEANFLESGFFPRQLASKNVGWLFIEIWLFPGFFVLLNVSFVLSCNIEFLSYFLLCREHEIDMELSSVYIWLFNTLYFIHTAHPCPTLSLIAGSLTPTVPHNLPGDCDDFELLFRIYWDKAGDPIANILPSVFLTNMIQSKFMV